MITKQDVLLRGNRNGWGVYSKLHSRNGGTSLHMTILPGTGRRLGVSQRNNDSSSSSMIILLVPAFNSDRMEMKSSCCLF